MHQKPKQQKRKLQSAIEYITTYAWAIVIIVVVLAVIFALDLFSSGKYTPTECTIGQALTCQNVYISTNGVVTIQVIQSGPDPINITSYGCEQNSSIKNQQVPYNPPTNQIYLAIGKSYTFSVQCYTPSNAPVSLGTGSLFSGSVFVNYTDAVTGYSTTDIGKVVLKAQPILTTSTTVPSCYSLTLSASPSGSGSLSPNVLNSPECPSDSYTYTPNQQITLVATANSGYSFNSWSAGSFTCSNSLTTCNVIMPTASATETAAFSSIPTQIEFCTANSNDEENSLTAGSGCGLYFCAGSNYNVQQSGWSWNTDVAGPGDYAITGDQNPDDCTVGSSDVSDQALSVIGFNGVSLGGYSIINTPTTATGTSSYELTSTGNVVILLACGYNICDSCVYDSCVYPSLPSGCTVETSAYLQGDSDDMLNEVAWCPEQPAGIYTINGIESETDDDVEVALLSGSSSAVCYQLSLSAPGTNTLAASPIESSGCPPSEYTGGQALTLTATASTGYTFNSWSGSFTTCSNSNDICSAAMPGSSAYESAAFSCSVGTPLQVPAASPSVSYIYQGETAYITDSGICGGTGTYKYQWFATTAGNSIFTAAQGNTLCGTSANTLTCAFATTNAIAIGTYMFELKVTDSGSPANSVTSAAANVILTAPPSMGLCTVGENTDSLTLQASGGCETYFCAGANLDSGMTSENFSAFGPYYVAIGETSAGPATCAVSGLTNNAYIGAQSMTVIGFNGVSNDYTLLGASDNAGSSAVQSYTLTSPSSVLIEVACGGVYNTWPTSCAQVQLPRGCEVEAEENVKLNGYGSVETAICSDQPAGTYNVSSYTWWDLTLDGSVAYIDTYIYLLGSGGIDMPLWVQAPTPATNIILQGQTTSIVDGNASFVGASGGSPSYHYQWLATAAGGSTFTAAQGNSLCGASADTYTCSFSTSTSTTVGKYMFELQVTDSGVPANVADSAPANVTLESTGSSISYIYCISTGLGLGDVAYSAVISDGLISSWTPTTPPSTVGNVPYSLTIQASTCNIYNGYIYCEGGWGGSDDYSGNAIVSATISNGIIGTWATTTPYPNELTSDGCSIYSGYIYCPGSDGDYPTNENTVYSATVSNGNIGSWAAQPIYPAPDYPTSCSVDNGYIYCAGAQAVYSATVSAGTVGTWQVADSTGWSSGGCSISGNYLYCVGNYEGDTSYTGSAPFSGYTVGPWSTDTDSYPTVFDGTCTTYAGYIYCVGGEYDNGGIPYSEDLYSAPISDGTFGSWTQDTSFPMPYGGELACNIPGSGGSYEGGGGPSTSSNPLILAAPSPTSSVIAPGHTANIIDSGAIGGDAPYSYQWIAGFAGNTLTASEANALLGIGTTNGLAQSQNAIFATNSLTATGNYTFELRVTDSGVPANSVTSAAATVLVQSATISSTYIYCVGSSTSPYTQAYSATISNGLVSTWTSTTSYPIEATDTGCNIYNGYIYCVGSTEDSYNEVYSATISNGLIGSWTPTTSYPIEPMYDAGCSVYDGYLYCVGSETSPYNQVYSATVSDGNIGPWTSDNPYPLGFDGDGCSISSGYIYCVGGNAGSYNQVYSATVSNGLIGTWTSTTSYPIEIYDAGCSISNGYIYCVGGPSTDAVYSATVSNGLVGSWTPTTSYPLEYMLEDGCFISGGYIYCVGGYLAPYTQVYSATVSAGTVGSWTATTPYPVSEYDRYCYIPGSGGGFYGGGGPSTSSTPLILAAPSPASSTIALYQTANIIDSGAIGGDAPYSYQWIAGFAGNTLTASEANALLGIGTSNGEAQSQNAIFATNTLENTGNYVFELQATDSGVPANSVTSAAATVLVQPANILLAYPTPTTNIIAPGQTAYISETSASGGDPPYTYQWFATTAGNSIFTAAQGNTLCGTSANTLTCAFATTNSMTTGNYLFKLQVKDSASPANMGNTIIANVIVSASASYIYCVGTGGTSPYTLDYSAPIGTGIIGSWTSTTSYPVSMYNDGCDIYNNYIYCVGTYGSGTDEQVYSATVSGGTIGTWTSTTSYPIAMAQDGCSAYDGYIYCVGTGQTGTLEQVYTATISNGIVGTWGSSTSYPVAMYYAGCSISNGYIYCVGTAGSSPYNTVYSASVSGGTVGTWSSQSIYPTAMYYDGCSIYNNYIYCIGTDGGSPDTLVYSASVSGGTVGTWTATTSYPSGGLVDNGCASYGGYIYCIGSYASPYVQAYSATVSNGIVGTWTAQTSYPVDKSGAWCEIPGSGGGYLSGGGPSS